MNCRVLVAIVLVAACRTAAFGAAPDDTDDLAEALIAQGWPDLAEDLLARTASERGLTWDEEAAAASARLARLEEAARKIEDPFWRKEALLDVLAQTDTFLGRFEGTMAATQRRNALPDLYADIGEAIVGAIKKSQDADAIEAMRTQGESAFARAEKQVKARIDELAAVENRDEEQDFGLMAARYNHARLPYLHAMLFPRESARRKELCEKALSEYGEFDLDYTDTLLNIYVYVDVGLCLAEIGKPAEALKSFDQAIQVRESWGDRDAAGVWPIEGDEIRDIVCYAMLQKVLLLARLGDRTAAIGVAKDYLASIPEPWRAPSSMCVARELGDAQIATGDVEGAAETARKMIEADPDGLGASWGREILAR